MTNTTDHKGRESHEHQFNLRLKIEGYGTQDAKDRKSLARTAQAERAERAERRRLIEMRRRPGYAAVEAKEPFQAETRLIRASDRLGAAEPNDEAIEPAGRPTFEEMRAQAEDFPPVPGEVREHERRKREQRRTAARVRKQAKRDRTKK